MAVALSMNFTACINKLNVDNAESIKKLLNQKYGIEFEVKSIGNRLADGELDTVKAYCYPKNNDKVIFDAVMNIKNELVFDDYLVRLLETEAKEVIESRMAEVGIKATVAVSVSHIDNELQSTDLNLKDIIAEHPELSLTFSTVLCENVNAEDLYNVVADILNGFYSGNPNMMLGTTIWKYTETACNKCSEDVNSVSRISKTLLEKYDPISQVNIAIVYGTINKSLEEFVSEF